MLSPTDGFFFTFKQQKQHETEQMYSNDVKTAVMK